jgi:hypothetical protein
MYAVLILSQSPTGVRQTVIAKTNDQLRSFTRVGFARGLGATWSEFDTLPVLAGAERVHSYVKVIEMTPAHVRDVNIMGRTPNNVLQAILKNLPNTTLTDNHLSDVYSGILKTIQLKPQDLQEYVASITHMPVSVASVEVVADTPASVPTQTIAEPITHEPVAHLATTVSEAVTDSSTIKELATLTVPEPTEYVERKFQGVTEQQVYDKSLANRWNVLLVGDAGTGKTSSARNLAARRQVPFVVVECNQQIDITVTQGRFVPGADGKSLKWVYSQLATAIQQPSVILLNEVTRMNPKSASLFLRLLEERELAIDTFNEVIKVHPECILIGDANVGGMYNGTTRADAAFTDRFGVKLAFSYDTDLEQKFLPYPALLNFAKGIRTASDLGQQDFSVPMSTRLLKSFVAQAQVFSWQFAVERLLSSFPSDTGERNAIKTRLEADAPAIASELNVTI